MNKDREKIQKSEKLYKSEKYAYSQKKSIPKSKETCNKYHLSKRVSLGLLFQEWQEKNKEMICICCS